MIEVLVDRDLDETELSPEAAKVIKWRQQWLRAAGYSRRNSELIATEITINYRFACELLKNSENEELCMRILF